MEHIDGLGPFPLLRVLPNTLLMLPIRHLRNDMVIRRYSSDNQAILQSRHQLTDHEG